MRSRGYLLTNLVQRLRRIKAPPSEDSKQSLQWLDLIGSESAPLEPRTIGAKYPDFPLTHSGRVRQNILRHYAVSADHRVPADTAELMYSAPRSNNCPFANGHVSAKGGAMRQNRMVANMAVMGDMRISLKKHIAAD